MSEANGANTAPMTERDIVERGLEKRLRYVADRQRMPDGRFNFIGDLLTEAADALRRPAQPSRGVGESERIQAGGLTSGAEQELREALKDARVFVQDCIEQGDHKSNLGNLYGARDLIDAAVAKSKAHAKPL